MGIDYTFPGFPLVSQLTDPPGNPWPDNNETADCVPASLSAGFTWLLKRIYYASQLKDIVYGNAYQGATDPGTYADYAASQGLAMTPYTSDSGAQLVAHIHAELQAGHPVALSMPSQWGIPYRDPVHPNGPTHEAIACGYGPGWLRMMNPWGGFFHDGADAYWAPRLTYGIVWDMALKGGPAVWHRQADKRGLDDKGHGCGEGAMDYLVASGLSSVDGLMGETYYTRTDSALPLANGRIVTYDPATGVSENGAAAFVAVWEQLQAAKAGQVPADPHAAAALDIVQRLKALEGQLP